MSLLAWLLVVMGAAGCTDDGPSRGGSSGATVADPRGDTVAIAGFRVTGLPDAAKYRATAAGGVEPDQSWMTSMSPAFTVEPSGAGARFGELAALSRAVSGPWSIVASGDEVVSSVSLPENSSARMRTGADHLGQSLSALQVGLTTLIDIVTLFKPDPKSIPAAVRASDYTSAAQQVLKIHECAAPLGSVKDVKPGDYLTGCLNEETMSIGDCHGHR